MPFTSQVTTWICGPVTVAVNCCCAAPDMVAVVGDTVTTVCWLPPPDFEAMHPASGSSPNNRKIARYQTSRLQFSKELSKEPPIAGNVIERELARGGEVCSVDLMFSRLQPPVKRVVEPRMVGLRRLTVHWRIKRFCLGKRII